MRTMIATLALCGLMAAPALAAPADKDVLAAMDAWKQAMLKKDKAGLEKVFHSDLTYGHSSGVIENKAQAIEHVVNGGGTYTAINLTDTKVVVHGNTALVTGKAEYHEITKEKKETTANLVVLSTWMKGAKGWQMIARQATKPAPAPAPVAATPPPAPTKP
jgi:ketosteroid isomerase-like protein